MIQAKKEFNKSNPISIAPDALKILMDYEYPGNIRELKNIVYRSVLVAEGETITKKDLLIPEIELNTDPDEITFYADSTLEEVERITIKKMLDKHNGNKRNTANALGIGESTL